MSRLSPTAALSLAIIRRDLDNIVKELVTLEEQLVEQEPAPERRHRTAAVPAVEEPQKATKRKASVETRKKIAEAARRRWAEKKAAEAQAAGKKPSKKKAAQ